MKGFLRDLYNRPSCTDCPAPIAVVRVQWIVPSWLRMVLLAEFVESDVLRLGGLSVTWTAVRGAAEAVGGGVDGNDERVAIASAPRLLHGRYWLA